MLSTVPFRMVPPKKVRPPAPNKPLPPTSTVVPVLSSVPVMFTLPPERVKCDKPVSAATVKLPRFRVPLLTLIRPGLVHVVGLMFSEPPLTFMVPLLVNVAGLMVKVCPAVLALRVPALMMVPAQLCVRLP